MKNIIKKLIVTISMVTITLTVAGVSVFAAQDARPMPNSGASVTDTVKSNNTTTNTASAQTQAQTEITPSKT